MIAFQGFRLPVRQLLCGAACVVSFALASPAMSAETIIVRMDQAKLTKLPERVATIVVGNPLIADVTLQSGGLLVLTGKGYGVTNLVALDRAGNTLTELLIQVEPANDTIVVVYRGEARESYSCTPDCSPRMSVGDTKPYFENVVEQTTTRVGRAQGAGGGGGSAGESAAAR